MIKPIPAGEVITGSITKHMDRRFISSVDLVGLGDVELTIDRVEKHAVLKYLNGNMDENAILIFFAGADKPLKLCTTNIKDIILALGTSNASDWKGREIKLCVKKVKSFGKMQDAVRIAD
jgi:hypothetical protein